MTAGEPSTSAPAAAALLGSPLTNPVEAALAGARSQAEVRELPRLAALRAG